MTTAVAEEVVDRSELRRILMPRDGIVAERPTGEEGRFELREGPFESYARIVEVRPSEADPALVVVRQVVEYQLAIPLFGPAFAPGFRRRLRRIGTGDARWPWWHPPARMDARAAGVLSALALLAVAAGYLGTLLTQTITYAAAEFHAGKRAQGVALASVRSDVVLSLVLVAAADRRGRRRLLLLTTAIGAALTVFGAVAPSLAVLAGTQVVARSFVTASGVLILIVAAEEMPAGCRAYAVSLLAMAGGLGSGFAVMLLPVADLGPRGWRIEFAVAVLWLAAVAAVRTLLPESRRFEAHRDDRAYAASPAVRLAGHGRRLWLLAGSALLLSAFFTPASQFQNEFLRTEHHYSAARISAFILLTNTPGGLGIILGGRLADLHGRRLVAVVGLIGGGVATVLMFLGTGWTIWAWSVTGSVVGTAIIPALGVYGPELFPTGQRGRTNGIIKASDRVGSIIGLLVTGAVSARVGRIGPAIAALSAGPLILAVLVVTLYPETAHLELEELNPEDR